MKMWKGEKMVARLFGQVNRVYGSSLGDERSVDDNEKEEEEPQIMYEATKRIEGDEELEREKEDRVEPIATGAIHCKVEVTCIPFKDQYNMHSSNETFHIRAEVKTRADLVKDWWNIVTYYAENFTFQSDEKGSGPTNLSEMILQKWLFVNTRNVDSVVIPLFREYQTKLSDFIVRFMSDVSIGKDNKVWCQIVDGRSSPRVLVIGDLHSSPRSMSRIFVENRDMFEVSSLKLKPNNMIVFTGDIVDRGPFGLQLFALVTCLVLENWTEDGGNVVVCNGNHEDCRTFLRYGLNKELDRYGLDKTCDASNNVLAPTAQVKFLDYLPTCCVMKTRAGLILFTHGACPVGITEFSQKLQSALYTSRLHRPVSAFDFEDTLRIMKWGDFTAFQNEEAGYNKRRGPIVPYNLGVSWMMQNGFVQCITGHQDLAAYGCYVQPSPVHADKFMDIFDPPNPYKCYPKSPTACDLSKSNFPRIAYVLKPYDGTLDVTRNRIHTISSAIYSKYNKYSLARHTFVTITFTGQASSF